MMAISLRDVTADNWRQICRLEVSEGQKHLVAPNGRRPDTQSAGRTVGVAQAQTVGPCTLYVFSGTRSRRSSGASCYVEDAFVGGREVPAR
jgi:hypothetical protein